MDTAESVDGIPIRLTAERWFHIVENHDDMAGYYDDVLSVIENPDIILRGHGASFIAVKNYGHQRYLHVVYRQLSGNDGFIVTAYFSRKTDRRKAIWTRQ